MQRRVFDLLAYLEERADRAVSSDELLEQVWKGTVVTQASLHQAIRNARRVIGDDPESPAILVAVRGFGYRWVPESEPATRPSVAPVRFGDATRRQSERPTLSGDAWLVVVAGGEGVPVERRAHALDSIDEVRIQRASAPVSVQSGRLLTIGASSSTLSRHHASIVREDGRFVLEDAGSTNGSRISGRDVRRIELEHGDWITCGPMLLRFVRTAVDLGRDDTTLSHALTARARECAGVLSRGTPVWVRHEIGASAVRAARAIHSASGRVSALLTVEATELEEPRLSTMLSSAPEGTTLFVEDADTLPASALHALMRLVERGASKGPNPALALIASGTDEASELLGRLGAYQVALPALGDRLEDLGEMLAELDGTASGWTPRALEMLVLRRWSGADRELKNVVRAARGIAGEGMVDVQHLPAPPRGSSSDRG